METAFEKSVQLGHTETTQAMMKYHVWRTRRNKRRNLRAKNERRYRTELKMEGYVSHGQQRLREMENEISESQRHWRIFETRKANGHTCKNAARCDCEVSR